MKAGNTRGNAGAFGAAALAAALAAAGIARAGADGRVAQDTPERALTVEEIVAAPRPKTTRTPLPEDARIYIGSGV